MRSSFGIILLSMLLTGCGSPKTTETVFEKASDSCTNQTVPGQFVVRKTDGSIQVIRSGSKQAFISEYLAPNLSEVEYAEHDFIVKSVNKTEIIDSANSTNEEPKKDIDNWGVARIKADTLWKEGLRGEGVVVAVIDTGVDIFHPQLQSQIQINLGETGTDRNGKSLESNGVDDDKNGYIDDVYGWNFVTGKALTSDNSSHGTHVAGVIAAEHQDTIAGAASYVQGVAPGVKILPLAFLDEYGAGTLSDGVKAVRYAVNRGAKVINASWGGEDCSRSLRDEIHALAKKNVAFVSAAGNDSRNVDIQQIYPASLNLAAQITIGAVGSHDIMAAYSNYGEKAVHLFAPGTNIISTIPKSRLARSSGTSMATPFVSAAIALLMQAVPTATVPQIRAALYRSVAYDAQYINASRGRLDLLRAKTELESVVGQ